MNTSHRHDAYAKPPAHLREVYKMYQQRSESLDSDLDIVDFRRGLTIAQQTNVKVVGRISKGRLTHLFDAFQQGTVPSDDSCQSASAAISDAFVYEHRALSGLHILPSLLPAATQLHLLTCLLHRDLSDKRHKTNVHAHYKIQYPPVESAPYQAEDAIEAFKESHPYHTSPKHRSFFSLSPGSTRLFEPKDPALHKPLSLSKFLNSKLRWITLGGQYDWTNKVYPNELPPAFPADIADLLAGMFPDMKAQAAIVNVYTPGDTLSLHRDVSEDSDQGLVSISLGCDGIFIVGMTVEGDTDEIKYIVVRLRSGDAVYMSGPSRFAWHGVPQIIPGTCPDWLCAWPAEPALNGKIEKDCPEAYEPWRNWMENKRINLNVRQMTIGGSDGSANRTAASMPTFGY